VFWGPWNAVAGRDEFDVGFWDDARQLTRHGEAVLSLLNDRWRTQVEALADASGVVEFTATHGEHVAGGLWTARRCMRRSASSRGQGRPQSPCWGRSKHRHPRLLPRV
jgi:hypothetical protein